MTQKYKILIIACLILIIAAGGFWYFRNADDSEKDKLAFTTGFVLLDDEKSLVWSEDIQLSAEARTRFEDKVKEIQSNLAKGGDEETMISNYNNLAIYENYLGDYRAAYDAYLESLKLEDRTRITWQNFADVLLKIKAYKSAEDAYKKSIDINKYIPESYVKLADYYKVVGDDKKVEETYKLAIENIKDTSESNALILSDYADWLAGQKRYDEAIKIYEELIVKQPSNKAAIQRKIEGLRSK